MIEKKSEVFFSFVPACIGSNNNTLYLPIPNIFNIFFFSFWYVFSSCIVVATNLWIRCQCIHVAHQNFTAQRCLFTLFALRPRLPCWLATGIRRRCWKKPKFSVVYPSLSCSKSSYTFIRMYIQRRNLRRWWGFRDMFQQSWSRFRIFGKAGSHDAAWRHLSTPRPPLSASTRSLWLTSESASPPFPGDNGSQRTWAILLAIRPKYIMSGRCYQKLKQQFSFKAGFTWHAWTASGLWSVPLWSAGAPESGQRWSVIGNICGSHQATGASLTITQWAAFQSPCQMLSIAKTAI